MFEPYVANKELIWALPKAELHIHLEGTLEPEMMMEMASRNHVPIKYRTVDEVRSAYVFKNLQSFLDIYYAGCSVLVEEQDFYDLTIAYLQHAAAQGVCHAEVFFDPQSHTCRGISFETVIRGIHRALVEYETRFKITSRLIPCFLRHLSEDDAFATLDAAAPYLEWISAVGLDSSEAGNPPPSLPLCSIEPVTSASAPWPMRERRARLSTSGRPWKSSTPRGLIMASGASMMSAWSRAWSRNKRRSPCARCRT